MASRASVNPLRRAEQPEEHKHALVRSQRTEQSNLISEWASQDAHTIAAAKLTLRQNDHAIALAAAQICDHRIGHARAAPHRRARCARRQETISRRATAARSKRKRSRETTVACCNRWISPE
jgi:hypothetical protein